MHRIAALSAALVLAACVPASRAAQTPASPQATAAATQADPLASVLAGQWRDPANVARDRYRHPSETLTFFQLHPDQTVIEITPGGGWYSEVLAPYLRDDGQYVAAVVDPAAYPAGKDRDYQQKARAGLETKFKAMPALYENVHVVAFDPKAPVFGPAGSADLVLTFRNVHNWRMGGYAEAMFKGFYAVLKPGGVLGVVEHRAKADVRDGDGSGYVGQAQVIAMAKAAGFQLAASSEINANPRDTTDHPNGVWTLPPVNKHDPEDDAMYSAIGESDRMTLRFVKPSTP